MKDVTPAPAKPTIMERLEKAQEMATESPTEGFGTVEVETATQPENAPESAPETEIAASGPTQAAEEEGPVDQAPKTTEETGSPPHALAHLDGMTRRSVIAFAKSYYGGNSEKEREVIRSEWDNLERQGKDAAQAMASIMDFVRTKDIELLLKFTGLTEAELKEAA
jgi:hypothetical protein